MSLDLKIVVIVNNRPGRNQAMRQWQREKHVFHSTNFFEMRLGDPNLCDELLKVEPDILMIYGGDGSNHGCLQKLMLIEKDLKRLPRLVLRGGGTGNDFIRNFAKENISQAHDSILRKKHTPIDIGKITFPESPRPIYFLNGANVGYAGWVSEYMAKPGHFGTWKRNYALATLFAIKSCSPKEFLIAINPANAAEKIYAKTLANIAFMNGQYFGNGIHIAPHAKFNDGQIQLVEIRLPPAHYLPMELFRLFTGAINKSRNIRYVPCHSLRISWASNELMPIDVDGESYMASGFHVEILPKKLDIIGNGKTSAMAVH